MKDYEKFWEQLWKWLEEDIDVSLSAYEVQGKMTELESGSREPKDGGEKKA